MKCSYNDGENNHTQPYSIVRYRKNELYPSIESYGPFAEDKYHLTSHGESSFFMCFSCHANALDSWPVNPIRPRVWIAEAKILVKEELPKSLKKGKRYVI